MDVSSYLKLPEVALRLGVSEKTARRYIKSGTLPSLFVGNAYRVHPDELDAFVERESVAHSVVGGSEAPKAPAPLEESVDKERRAQDFLLQFPSENQRIKLLSEASAICNGYTDRWSVERDHIANEGTLPYGKSFEMDKLWVWLYERLKNDGRASYATWVLTEEPEVSPAECDACRTLSDAIGEMRMEVIRLSEVEQVNRDRAKEEDAPRGLEELERMMTAPENAHRRGLGE
jgi:excisionase family DNA binding protein